MLTLRTCTQSCHYTPNLQKASQGTGRLPFNSYASKYCMNYATSGKIFKFSKKMTYTITSAVYNA